MDDDVFRVNRFWTELGERDLHVLKNSEFFFFSDSIVIAKIHPIIKTIDFIFCEFAAECVN